VLIYEIHISGTAASGAYSVNTAKFDNVLLKQILLKSATATTTFGARLTDWKGNVVYETENLATGTLRAEMTVPLKGVVTIAIYSSSADEVFTGKVVVQEEF